ncbi:unnamed protein product [Caretta caretta]
MYGGKSILVLTYKGKGDVDNCANYRGIKLMSHTMKLWERVINKRLRSEVDIRANQYGFMPERPTIFAWRQLVEKFREKRKNIHMMFIDLENIFDRVPSEVI